MKKYVVIVLLLTGISGFAQKSMWTAVPANKALSMNKGKEFFPGSFKPAIYKLFTLDENTFARTIKAAPFERDVSPAKSGFFISIPLINGTIENFRIVESSMMQPKLQAKYPNIRSYVGQGVNDPSKNIRCDFTPLGFHAVISGADGQSYYINPVNHQSALYAVYPRDKNDVSENVFKCTVDESIKPGSDEKKTGFSGNANDGILRVYRLALCVAGEFSQYFLDGTEPDTAAMKAKVMAVLNTYMIRANQVYERDFDIRLELVDNEDTIIFINPKTDPFTTSLNTQTQRTCDKYIGNANYDIGHMISAENLGGNAGCIGCVCRKGQKGSGYTGYSRPDIVDYFVIDYWTHEMGHQFGANHTFDYSDEETGANVEPGSGSTIMGYAGVASPPSVNVQDHSDDYFHSVSIAQNTTYVQTGFGSNCGTQVVTGDSVPVVNAGGNHTIPRSTPFALTGTASDADASDTLTYCWEQIDVFVPGTSNKFPRSNSTDGPVFRSYNYSANPTRIFPQIEDVLSGLDSNKWEVLPAVSRDLNFRFTARDNHPGGGSNNSGDVVISVDGNSGPFKVTYPNTRVTIGSGSVKTIKWDVANTDMVPVNCTTVNIWLSVDSGMTFPYELAANTANDGSEDVIFPVFSNTISTARIKIESVGNIFFDISDTNFSIEAALPLSWLSFTAERSGKFDATLNWSIASETNNDHFEVERSKDGVNFTKLGSVTAQKNAAAVQNYSYTDVDIPSGTIYYRVKQVDKDGKSGYSKLALIIGDGTSMVWEVQPNPATDHITVIFNTGASAANIYLTDVTGRIVYREILQAITAGKELSVPLDNLAKGIYMLRITAGNETRTEKIIKN